MTTSLFIGRYQPFHAGHKALIDKVLNEGNDVVIAIRATPINEAEGNPYGYLERIEMIKKVYPDAVWFPNEHGIGRVTIVVIPDIDEVCYGRKVGWGIREIRLDEETEKISGTKIRKK